MARVPRPLTSSPTFAKPTLTHTGSVSSVKDTDTSQARDVGSISDHLLPPGGASPLSFILQLHSWKVNATIAEKTPLCSVGIFKKIKLSRNSLSKI